MFFTGIIKQLKLTDDEVAAIMGHEIAHALREHGRERVSQAYAQSAGLSLMGALTGMSPGTSALLEQAAQVGLTLPNGRGQESEADIIGLELMARAGYNPQAAITLWQKMAAATGNSSSSFLSTHPGNAQRINALQAAIPKVMPLYEQARRNPAPSRARVPRT
jgi:Zn-dependent protease with chaperone function